MSTTQQRLAKLFDPHHPLYLRKLTTVIQLNDAMNDIARSVEESAIRAVVMTLALYESDMDLYQRTATEREVIIAPEVITHQIDVLRAIVMSWVDTPPFNDYLIIMWSATGDLQYLIELVKRRQSLIEEVSVTSAWAIGAISEGSEIFKQAIANAVSIN